MGNNGIIENNRRVLKKSKMYCKVGVDSQFDCKQKESNFIDITYYYL